MVIGAVMGLDVAMLGAEDVGALAGDLHNAHFFGAMPALVLVCLDSGFFLCDLLLCCGCHLWCDDVGSGLLCCGLPRRCHC